MFRFKAASAVLVVLPFVIGCQSEDQPESPNPTAIVPSQSWHFGGSGFQAPGAIAAAPDLVLLGGSFSDHLEYQATKLSSRAGGDGFVLGLSPAGDLKFAASLSGSGDDAVLAAELDAQGRGVIGGRVTDGAELAGQSLSARSEWSALLARLDATGALEWAVSSTGTGLHSVSSVALAEDGSIYAAGDFLGQMMLGSQALSAESGSDAFVARFSERGELVWLTGISGSGPQGVRQLAIDADGSLLVAGSFGASLNVGGEQRLSIPSFDHTPFVARFLPTGELDWLQANLLPPQRHDHSQHAPGNHSSTDTALGGISLTPEPSGEVSVMIGYGRFFGLHGPDFEAPVISTFCVARLASGGKLLARSTLEQPNSLLQVGSLLSGRDGSRLAASYSGEIAIEGETLVSRAPRSLLLSELSAAGMLHAPRLFGVSGVSLTSQDAVASDGSIWVAARWFDIASNEHDVFVARFEP